MRWVGLLTALVLMGMGQARAGQNWASVRAYMCRHTDTPPVIDGALDDVCWNAAEAAVGFHPRNADRTQFAEPGTTLRLCYDDSALYVAYECTEPNIGGMKAVPHPRDFDVYTEDMVGILLDVGHWRGGHYDMELALSAVATQYDFAWGLEEAWDGEWTAATLLHPAHNVWTAELRIPFSDTRQPAKKGDIWGMQAMRWRYAGGQEQVSIWSAVPASWGIKFWEGSTYGHLLFEAGEQILGGYVQATAERLNPQREEAVALAEGSADPVGNRAAVDSIFERLAALEQTAAKGTALTGDEWAQALAEAEQILKDFDDIVWPLRIEGLFEETR